MKIDRLCKMTVYFCSFFMTKWMYELKRGMSFTVLIDIYRIEVDEK